jgi:hypothetical protein
VQEQFQYHVFDVVLVVLTHEQVELMHAGNWLLGPCPLFGSEMFNNLFSTQQLYEVPFFVQDELVKLRFLKVEVLYVQLQFQYHDFVAALVVLTQEHVVFWHIGY